MDAPPPPPALPPLGAAEVQSIKDDEHLRLLSYAYYFVGGFTALFSSFGLIHFFIGLAVLVGGFPMSPPPPRHSPHHAIQSTADAPAAPAPANAVSPAPTSRPFSPDAPAPGSPGDDRRRPAEPFPDKIFGLLFMALGGTFVLLGWTVGGLTFYAGRCLRDRKHRVFTMIVAGVNCLHVPFGTMLGVFTFLVLGRPTVEALYRRPLPAGPTPPRA